MLSIVALAALSTPLTAAPRVVCSTPSLSPESEVDVIFERAVVAADALGKSVPMSHLAISPPIPGGMTWVSPEVVRLAFDAPPAKVESMYAPAHFALSASRTISATE